jgi:hypothetical protein
MQWFVRHISVAITTCTAVKEVLEVVFSDQNAIRPSNMSVKNQEGNIKA